MKHATKRPFAALLLLGSAVHAAYLAWAPYDPTFYSPIVDAQTYREQALGFAAGAPLSTEPYWQPPFFPWMLGWIYRLLGGAPWPTQFVLTGISLATLLLTATVARRHFGARVALAAGVVLAFHGPFLFFSHQLLPAGVAGFFVMAAIWLLWPRDGNRTAHAKAKALGSVLRWPLGGVAIGLGIITVPHTAVLALPVVARAVYAGWVGRGAGYVVRRCVAMFLGLAAPLMPVVWHNYQAAGAWPLISTNGGLNLYLGNNPEWRQTIAVRPGDEWVALTRLPYLDGIRDPVACNRFFYARALAYMTGAPAAFLSSWIEKFLSAFQAREWPRNLDVYTQARFNPVLAALLSEKAGLPMGVLWPLAGFGILRFFRGSVRSRKRSAVLLLALAVGLYLLTLGLFFMTSRYRIPAIPLICILAASGLVDVFNILRAIRRRHVSGWALTEAGTTLILIAMLAYWPARCPTEGVSFVAEMNAALASQAFQRGEFPQAIDHFAQAIEEYSGYDEARAALFNLYLMRGNRTAAQAVAAPLLERSARGFHGQLAAADLALLDGQYAAAVEDLRAAIALLPSHPVPYVKLGDAQRSLGRFDEAISAYRRAIGLDPLDGAPYSRLADLYQRRADFAAAIAVLKSGLKRWPSDRRMVYELAALLTSCPDVRFRDPREGLRLALALVDQGGEGAAAALEVAARACEALGDWTRAAAHTRRLLELLPGTTNAEVRESLEARLAEYEKRAASGLRGEP